MIPQAFEYSSPASLGEALQLISDGRSKVLAGGMSLIPMMKLRLAAPERLVDIARLPDLNFIREEAGILHIGAGTTHYQIESSPLLREKCPLFAETAARIGDVQVRNVGTLGGSIAHADPAADYPAALLALEAEVRLIGTASDRTVPVSEFFLDSFTTALQPGEIVLEIRVPVEASGTAVYYEKVSHPASGFAVIGVAVRVRKSRARVEMARIAVTGVANAPFRAKDAEMVFEHTAGTAEDIQRAAAAAVPPLVQANTDLYASADFRRHLAKVYTGRALSAALKRLG